MKKRILVTGACGFIGSHLTELLISRGYKVVPFDLYNSNNNWGWLENSKFIKKIKPILGDIRDYKSVYNAMKKCDAVMHLAALISIPYSYQAPLSFIQTNTIGTYNVLESAKNLNIKNIILTSTSEVYGDSLYLPIDEKHPPQSNSPYASTKIAADNLGISYYKSYNLPVKIIRPFNTFGPRQSARAVIPSLIAQCLNGEKTIKIGNIYPERDYTYVTDVCEAYLKVLNSKKTIGQIIHVGSNKKISIKNLAKKTIKFCNHKAKLVEDINRVRTKRSEVDKLLCNNKKILNLTNWKIKCSFDQGLIKTIKWIKENKFRYKSKLYNI